MGHGLPTGVQEKPLVYSQYRIRGLLGISLALPRSGHSSVRSMTAALSEKCPRTGGKRTKLL